MGRPPCCDKVGVKKGPWTPEEDIILVSYIQEHGPGNWRAVPTNTGLMRCSKSCRLRWTNYLRPGIKRGNFTAHEEKLIIHLQTLLGNRWAAIASYLPERTDNDIKNYWNTHLSKKLRKMETGDGDEPKRYKSMSKGKWERCLQTDIDMARRALSEALSMEKQANSASDQSKTTAHSGYNHSHAATSGPYASSAENISKLLEGWMKSASPNNQGSSESSSSQGTVSASNCVMSSSPERFDSLFGAQSKPEPQKAQQVQPFSFLESWLLDENVGQAHDSLLNMVELF